VPRLRDSSDAAGNDFVFADPGPGVDHFIAGLFGNNTNGGYFGQNPVAKDFGANVFKVADGDTSGFPSGMNSHGEYFDPVSDRRRGRADRAPLHAQALHHPLLESACALRTVRR
jgi:hypothetical protein